jgi:hypothetical protein
MKSASIQTELSSSPLDSLSSTLLIFTYQSYHITDIIKLFDEQTIHLWSALLMKRRVVVYSDRLAHVLRVIRALPLFVFHRQDWDILRPYVVRPQSTRSPQMRTASCQPWMLSFAL